MKRLGLIFLSMITLISTQGCLAMMAVDVAAGVTGAAVGAAGEVVEGTYDVTTNTVGAIIPGDGDEDSEDNDDEDDEDENHR